MLLRLAYLGVTNVFALLRLLPVSSRDKDAEISRCATSSCLPVPAPAPGPAADRALGLRPGAAAGP